MSGISGSLGLSSSKTKYDSTTSIDERLRAMQEGNFAQAQGLFDTYTPTSGAQIAGYMNPYIEQVADNVTAQAGKGQRSALNLVGDRADAAGAFGGSRHGVAEGVALGEFDANMSGLLGGLFAQGYEGARETAQQENQMGYAYPMERMGLLNASLAGITPTTTTKGSSKTKGMTASISGSYGGG